MLFNADYPFPEFSVLSSCSTDEVMCVFVLKGKETTALFLFCSWSGNFDPPPFLWSHTSTVNQTLTCFSLLPLKQSLYQRRHLSHSVFNETFPWNTHQWNTPFLLHSSEIRRVSPSFIFFFVLPLLKVVRQRVRGRTPALQWYTTLNVTINGYNMQTVSKTELLEQSIKLLHLIIQITELWFF